ncbi:MAG: DUF2141 domain-containing protein [Kangiellaceae bacterium]|nr:DUF2141 domain-containing protein [Kangiellaceae bacterium]
MKYATTPSILRIGYLISISLLTNINQLVAEEMQSVLEQTQTVDSKLQDSKTTIVKTKGVNSTMSHSVADFSKIDKQKTLTVEISGIDPIRGGNIIVLLFKDKGFPKNHQSAVSTQNQRASVDTLSFTFDINVDELAIKILHDEDENGKVTKNWTGIIPKEGLGFSNKQTIGFTGPPSYKKSKIQLLQQHNDITISIIYP